MNGYFVSITNNLLEDKHYEQMGNAVWLYMWLIDKMTDISEGTGIVNYGNPITYSMVNERFSTLSERTYRRMVLTLRKAGYINTVQAKYGLYVTINKAKKQFNKKAESSQDKNGTPQTPRHAKSGHPGVPNVATSQDKNGTPLIYKELTNTTYNNNITNTEIEISGTAQIGVLYYEAIKALRLPVLNHNVIKAKIKALEKEDELHRIINYLAFIKNDYKAWRYEFKPRINTALDIYSKRIQIEDRIEEQIEEQNKVKKGRGFRVR